MTEIEAFTLSYWIARPLYKETMMKNYNAKFLVMDMNNNTWLVWADTGKFIERTMDIDNSRGRSDWLPLTEAINNWKKENQQ